MRIKLNNTTCKNCKRKKVIAIPLNQNKIKQKETPLPETPDPDYYYETFWSIKKIPPK